MAKIAKTVKTTTGGTFAETATMAAPGDFTWQIAVTNSGNTTLTNVATGETAIGSYDSATRRFDFPTSFTGFVQALNVGEHLPGDLIVAGGLDVRGDSFGFSADAGNPNKPAFGWLHRSSPIVPGAPAGNHLRWLTATPLYE